MQITLAQLTTDLVAKVKCHKQQVGEAATSMEQLLQQDLQQAPTLHQGQLDNGLKYVLLPNKSPPERFEAHLEMHVGKYSTCVFCSHISHRREDIPGEGR